MINVSLIVSDTFHPSNSQHTDSLLVCCRKEHRFLLNPTQPLTHVVAEVRRQTGLKDGTKFNLKWLDVEGQ